MGKLVSWSLGWLIALTSLQYSDSSRLCYVCVAVLFSQRKSKQAQVTQNRFEMKSFVQSLSRKKSKSETLTETLRGLLQLCLPYLANNSPYRQGLLAITTCIMIFGMRTTSFGWWTSKVKGRRPPVHTYMQWKDLEQRLLKKLRCS